MKTVTISDIKRKGSKALKGKGPIYVIVNSKPIKVALSVDEYESVIQRLEQLEKEKEMSLAETSEEHDEENWETVIDFTEGGTKRGAPAEDVLKALKEIREEEHG